MLFATGRCDRSDCKSDFAECIVPYRILVDHKPAGCRTGETPKMHLLRIVTMLVALASLWSTAWAGGREVNERAARKACLTGDFSKGVDILVELFLDTKDINYIFNQGRCLEQNRRYEDAIGRFREYLVKGTALSREEREEAERHISVCLSYSGKDVANQASVAEAHKPGQGSTPNASSEASNPGTALINSPPVVTAESAPPAGQNSRGATLRATGIVVASVGVVGVATGIILNVKVNSMSSDLEKQYNYTRSVDSTRQTYKTVGWVGYGAGAVGIATGAVLYLLGWTKGEQRGGLNLALAPAITVGSAGATLSGAFQ
jgi:hypothetical protein